MKKKYKNDDLFKGGPISNQEITVLLKELQIAQLELGKQNEELYASSQLLKAERAKFEQLFNFAPVGYFILDRLGVIQNSNQAASHLLNIHGQHITGMIFRDFVAPEDWEPFYLFLHKLQTSTNKESMNVRILLKNGISYYTRAEGIQIKSKDNEELYYYITITDVSEIRLAQQHLLATAQRLEMTLSASGTGTWSLDLGSRRVYMDNFCLALFELEDSEFDGTLIGFLNLVHPEDKDKVWHDLSKSINTTNQINLEFRVLLKNNKTKIYLLKGKEVENNNIDKFYVGILSDITLQQSRADRALRLSNERQKLILSTTFDAQEKERQKISVALHDSVCQLLYGVKLTIQNLQKTNNDEFRKINELIDQAITETRELSYDLTPSILRDFGFTAGVKEIAQRFSIPNFKINTYIKKEADLLQPNVQLIVFRIMQELLNNCIKHSHSPSVEITVATEGELVTLVVSDKGNGFDTTLEHALAKGSGLRGVKNRIFLLDGLMDIASSNEGTTITVSLNTNLEVLNDDELW